jgi:hypothetical protein
MIAATGPKVSSFATSIESSALSRTVGAKKLPPAEPLPPFTLSPPRATVAPFCLASATWRSTFSMALGSISGPTSTPSSVPSPTLIAAILSVSFSENSSRMPLWTKTRLAQTHVWPMLRILETRAPSTAASTSASSKTMKGAWPPSSRERRFMVSADCLIRSLPTSVEPVKESLRTRRSSMIGAVMAEGSMPAITERTPFGRPASSKMLAISRAERGVSSDGFMTIVQPAARAGPSLRVIMAAGKFHGVIAAVTPTGRLMTIILLPGWLAGTVSP